MNTQTSTSRLHARQRALGAVSALVLTAACAATPQLGDAASPVDPASLISDTSFAAPAAAWPGDRWWRAYQDPQLTALIEAGLAASPTLAEAKARYAKAAAQVGAARAPFLPNLSGTAQASEIKQSQNQGIPPQFVPDGFHDTGRATLDFSYEFDFFGKNRKRLAAAVSDRAAAAADRAQARLVLSTSIAAAYADLSRLYAERDVARDTERARSQTADLVGQRVERGLDTEAELKQARAAVPAAKADAAAIDEQIALMRNRLAALIGAGPDRGLAIARPSDAALKPFGLPDHLAAELLGRRPDIAAARLRARAAAERVGAAKAAFYPNIDLTAYYGVQSLGLDTLFKAGSGIGQIGPAITLPIFQAGTLRANYRGARAEFDAAVASYDAALVNALNEVADASTSLKALDTRLSLTRDALSQSEGAYAVARQRYEAGLSSYLSVLSAEDAVLSLRRAVADLEARALSLDISLVKALGGGFQASETRIADSRS